MAGGISFKMKGNFKKVTRYLERVRERIHLGMLDKYGKIGVEALMLATPVDTGETAMSWYYEIENNRGQAKIVWKNSHIVGGYANLAVLIQYGHATGNGGYVQGIDYINPAMRPVFNRIAQDAWKEVSKL